MAVGSQPTADSSAAEEPIEPPAVSVCEGRPGRRIFLESGNTDGWIASDLTVDVTQ